MPEDKPGDADKKRELEFETKLSLAGRLVRRGVHLSSFLIIIYFIFPDIVFEIGSFRLHRALALVLLFFLIPFPLEVYRLYKGSQFFMQRDHEKGTIAAYIWTLVGSMTLCLLTEVGLPEFIAIPIIICASLGDLLLGETRILKRMRRRHIYSLAVLMCSFFYFVWLGNPIIAIIAGFLTVLSESLNVKVTWGLRKEMLYNLEHKHVILRKIKALNLSERLFHTDDNLMMQMIPLFFLLIMYLALPQLFPPNSMIMDKWPTDIISSHQWGTFFGI